MDSFFTGYCHVDGYFEHPLTGRRSSWMRIQATELIERVVKPSSNSGCFASVQRYMESVSIRDQQKEADERAKNQTEETDGDRFLEQQVHYHGLYFDFDCKAEPNGITTEEALGRSREDAMKVVDFFETAFDINSAVTQIWFTGSKGFHVMVRPEVFGIRPHRHLTYIVQRVANDLVHLLEMRTLDKTVYTVSRMWRLPNSSHHKTRLYKTELTRGQLRDMPISDIMKLAESPHGGIGLDVSGFPMSDVYDACEYEAIAPNKQAAEWWQEYVAQYDAAREAVEAEPGKTIIVPDTQPLEWPKCIGDILDNGPKLGGGKRNRVLIPLVAFLKDVGQDKEHARRVIRSWTAKHFPEQESIRERQANGNSVIDSVYAGSQYHFSCASMHANKGPGPDGRIKCDEKEHCPFIRCPEDQEPKSHPMLPLYACSEGSHINTQVKTPIQICGIAGQPYGVPSKGKIVCVPDPDSDLCANCGMCIVDGEGKAQTKDAYVKSVGKTTRAEMVWSFSSKDREILSLIDVNDARRRGTIKLKLGIPPKCFRHRMEVLENSNIEKVSMIPMIDSRAWLEDGTIINEEDQKKQEDRHVVRDGFFLGYGIRANKKYVLEPWVYQHPEDQHVVYAWDKMEDAQNDLDSFKMTDELYQQLLLFQPKEGETVDQKLAHIHADFEANVHRIRGRGDMSVGIDLAYHAATGFRFQNEIVTRGWFELLVMGDSGAGKSQMVRKLMNHFGLGELIGGEEAKRTGLVFFNWQTSGGQWMIQWGSIPQNDRRLVVIDEFGDMPPEEVKKMTQLRSEGKAHGQGVSAGQETWARTRLVFLTNPKSGDSLGKANYGIETVDQLFDQKQDLRRVDWAICVKEDDVDISVVNEEWNAIHVPHMYTADRCRNLILWAWSREPHQIAFEEDAEKLVLTWANRLGELYKCDIPLAQHSDLRLKVARIAVAVAQRLFSTDTHAKNVVVKKEHVEYAARAMDSSYRKPAMAYREYAKVYQQDNTYTTERKAKIRTGLDRFPDPEQLHGTLSKARYITKTSLAESAGYDKEIGDDLWKFMISNQLITQQSAKGYRKTPAFTEFLKEIGSRMSGYDGGDTADGRYETPLLFRPAKKRRPPGDNSGEDPPY